MVKHEAQASSMGPGLRPYAFRPFPMMVHKAGRPTDAKGDVKLGPNTIIEQRIADTQTQADQWFHEGFRPSPLDALEHFEAQQLEIAKLAAEINYDVKNRLSPKAGSDVARAQAAAAGHLPMVPTHPIKKRRGRPAKVATPETQE